ncbi:MAG: AAA family ATPase [Clostridia bacterium]|nr:AAA family ATPase [Clostridia bacterium]MBQ9408108.1 AAA family ATPase [Clostridia bacterium]
MIIKALTVERSAGTQDGYLERIPAISALKRLDFDRPVTFFVGENGSGKSTLLEAMAIAAGFNPEGGTLNYRFSTHDSHSDLHRSLHLIRTAQRPSWGLFLRAESFYNVATAEEDYAEGRSLHLHDKSHGESFLAMMFKHFRPGGLYFLDEPEAALSPQRQLTLLTELNRCREENAQFFIATHSPILLALPEARILSFDGEIHPIEYTQTESYQITDMFINRREQILKRLLED